MTNGDMIGLTTVFELGDHSSVRMTARQWHTASRAVFVSGVCRMIKCCRLRIRCVFFVVRMEIRFVSFLLRDHRRLHLSLN